MPEKELSEMVGYLVRTGYLKSQNVKRAMLKIDRADFIPKEERRYAYADCALPIGFGQTISAPSVVAFMLEKLEIKEGMKILEVGTGSGYNCALLSELAGKKGKVISIDVVHELVERAKGNINKTQDQLNKVQWSIEAPLQSDPKRKTVNWKLETADGSAGYPSEAPFDRIIVTAAMPHFNADHPLAKQLTGNGKLIAPVGSRLYQDLVLYDKKTGKMEYVLPVMFVPLIGEYGFKE